MEYLAIIGEAINNFLNNIYSILTEYFQSINLDGIMAGFCKYHLVVSMVVFLLILTYFIFFDEDKTYLNLMIPKNIVILLVVFGLFYAVSDKSVNLSVIGLGTITVTPVLLMAVGKLYGAIPAAVFGAAEYFVISAKDQSAPLMTALFFIYAIGGLIHGWLLYKEHTAFWRCLVARVFTVILCNILLIPLVRASFYAHAEPLSVFIPQTITTNVLQIPIQATLGYFVLYIIKKLREQFDF